MPLDPVLGEPSDDLGRTYKVAPARKWQETPFFEIACQNAANAFHGAGAVGKISFFDTQIVVQEYPTLAKLEFVFVRPVAGKEMFYRYRFDLPPPLIAELVTAGRWERQH